MKIEDIKEGLEREKVLHLFVCPICGELSRHIIEEKTEENSSGFRSFIVEHNGVSVEYDEIRGKFQRLVFYDCSHTQRYFDKEYLMVDVYECNGEIVVEYRGKGYFEFAKNLCELIEKKYDGKIVPIIKNWHRHLVL